MEETLPKPPTVPATEETPAKPKREPTEAQKAARAKGLAAMTAKRKELSKQMADKKDTIKLAKKAVAEKIIKEDLVFATRNDVDSLVGGLRKELAELKALHTVKQEQAKEEKAKPTERIVERIIEKTPTAPAPVVKLTGHALLDSIFFNK